MSSCRSPGNYAQCSCPYIKPHNGPDTILSLVSYAKSTERTTNSDLRWLDLSDHHREQKLLATKYTNCFAHKHLGVFICENTLLERQKSPPFCVLRAIREKGLSCPALSAGYQQTHIFDGVATEFIAIGVSLLFFDRKLSP